LTTVSLYIGSLDGYNKLSFTYADGTTAPLMSGQWVSDNTISQSNGDQQNGDSNGRLTLTFDKPVTSVVLSSDTNSFEISEIAGGVPEPATWGLMIVGFGGAGAVLRGQRRRQPVAATA
ncbi:PEPxxWA-CTERM sorting domain-containing protein, partial [Phenylobacterium sp.]|uniref:PEPxxWA-CTERM sorting domain-containing protein n=1 Tax=Phenylobacterium sp. TaxID=1871053 RepID=UPI0011FDE8D3